jgi:uncharacterized protein (TIGR02246 family)
MRTRSWLCLITIGVLSVSCAPATEDADSGSENAAMEAEAAEAEAALRATVAEMLAAYNAEDIATIERLYAEDIVIIPPGESVRDERAAVIENLATLPEADYTIEADIRDLQMSGDLAITWVAYSDETAPRDGSESTTTAGRWALVWTRNAAGQWLISREIWNLGPVSPAS